MPLPAGVDLSAYRIVQEALTNARKHAGPVRARVAVRWRADAIELEIANDARRARSPHRALPSRRAALPRRARRHRPARRRRAGASLAANGGAGDGGQGLVGMRERVALYGGDLHAGPRPEGGFVVRATLPLA